MSSAKLRPITIDGGFPIVAERADSVGIVYPGERLDVAVEWAQGAESNFPQLQISLE
jgi:hypothetical protein